MKKLLLCGLSLSLLFAGCGQPATPVADSVVEESVAEATPTEEPTPEPTAEPTAEPTPETTPEPTPTPEGTYTWEGTIVDDEDIYKEPFLTVENMAEHFESGPLLLNLTGMQISKIIFHDEGLASYADLDAEQEATMVSLDFTAENTSDDDIYFDFYSTITTNNKEQAKNSHYGEYPDGTYHGNVVQTAQVIYFLETSTPETLEEMNFIFETPYSETQSAPAGEDIKFTIRPADYEGL